MLLNQCSLPARWGDEEADTLVAAGYVEVTALDEEGRRARWIYTTKHQFGRLPNFLTPNL